MPWNSDPKHWKDHKESARRMRTEPTPAEKTLWQVLRNRKMKGVKFRRQYGIGPFVVDFYAASARLVIEVDGPIHDSQQAEDARRQSYLESGGFRVLRFANEAVLGELDQVLTTIANVVERRSLLEIG